jgi:hypothetical protein
MGVKLAAFLYDLNTNQWGYNLIHLQPLPVCAVSGNAFADAGAIYRYRRTGIQIHLVTVCLQSAPFMVEGANAFKTILLMVIVRMSVFRFSTNGIGLVSAGYLNDTDNAGQPGLATTHANAFFTIQDLFDRTKTSPVFGDSSLRIGWR